MGWLDLVASIQLQVAFAEYRLFHGALLQKRPIILAILLTVATPYVDEGWSESVCERVCAHPLCVWESVCPPISLYFCVYEDAYDAYIFLYVCVIASIDVSMRAIYIPIPVS